ncbi:MAG: S4 domain-containing protein [Candidatus Hodarchaeota archaeon]
MRLDEYLVQNQLISSRSKANRLIQEVGVLINGNLIKKPAYLLKPKDRVEINKEILRNYEKPLGYHKLVWIELNSPLSFNSEDFCLDLGASAGGFSIFMLERTKSVLAIEISPQFKPFLEDIKNKWSNYSYRIANFFEMTPKDFPYSFNVITTDLTLDPYFLIQNLDLFPPLLQENAETQARLLLNIKTGNINQIQDLTNQIEKKVMQLFQNPSCIWIKSVPGKQELFLLIICSSRS